MYSRCLQDITSSHLEDVLSITIFFVFQDILKTSARYLARCLQHVFRKFSRRPHDYKKMLRRRPVEDIFETWFEDHQLFAWYNLDAWFENEESNDEELTQR